MTQSKRERILESALKVFARKGFYNAKVSEIASTAGVADGTIYLYFKSKDDILISLFEDRMDWLIRRLTTELEKVDGVIPQLRRYVELHLALSMESPDLAEFITVELRQSAKFVKEYANPKFNEYLKNLRTLIARGQDEGKIRDDVDARLLSRALFGAMDELLLTAVLSNRASNELVQDWSTQVWRAFFEGLAVKE